MKNTQLKSQMYIKELQARVVDLKSIISTIVKENNFFQLIWKYRELKILSRELRKNEELLWELVTGKKKLAIPKNIIKCQFGVQKLDFDYYFVNPSP